MADNTEGSYAFTVPGLGITPGQALMFKQQQEQQNQARQDAIDERNQYRKDQEQQRNEFRQGNLLKEEFNPTKFQTGVGLIDQYTSTKLGDLLREFSDPKYASMPLNEFTGMVMSKVKPIQVGSEAIKNRLNQETAIIKNAVAQNKYLDGAKLMNDVRDRVANEYMIPDGKGSFTFRPIDQVNQNKSDTLDILNSPDSFHYVNNQGISDYLKAIRESATSAKPQMYSLKRPDGGITNYQGRLSPFQQMTEAPDQYGFVKKQPQYSIISEQGRVDKAGNPINTVPENILNRLTDTPANAMVFNNLFDDYAARTGVNPNDPTERQKFAYTMLNNVLGNEQPFVHSQQQPQRAPHTTINNGSSKEVGIRDVYGEISNKLADKRPGFDMPFNELSPTAQELLIKHANSIYPDRMEKFNQSNVQIGKRDYDGQIHLINTQTGESIMPITYEDINTSANTGVKAKQQVLKNRPSENPAKKQVIPQFKMK